jgi:hypothetical protein
VPTIRCRAGAAAEVGKAQEFLTASPDCPKTPAILLCSGEPKGTELHGIARDSAEARGIVHSGDAGLQYTEQCCTQARCDDGFAQERETGFPGLGLQHRVGIRTDQDHRQTWMQLLQPDS